MFSAGESSTAIAYHLAMKDEEAQAHFGLKMGLFGVSLVQDSYYIGLEAQDPSRNALVDWLLPFVCQNQPDNDDLQVNPVAKGAPSLAQFARGFRRVLVCVARIDGAIFMRHWLRVDRWV